MHTVDIGAGFSVNVLRRGNKGLHSSVFYFSICQGAFPRQLLMFSLPLAMYMLHFLHIFLTASI